MVTLEIDGKKIEAPEGSVIIEAADAHGIYIPRFCYHKKLSIAANCRMCLVEVEKVGKPLPACATPITQEMKVYTKSKKTLDAQRAVMEYLLINHPLDCPICDQGGMCELQDLAMGYGAAHSRYTETKRAVFSEDIGPLIDTEMTRCIHCTRCVRFGEEIANLRELGVTYRGEHSEIGTYVKHLVKSELSGNVIDLCPVGALNSKPDRYASRPWELIEVPGIGAHDCVGTNIYIHARPREFSQERIVMRIVPRENEAINEVWVSDRDRFSVEALKSEDRIYKPRKKINGEWVEINWQDALTEIASRLQEIQKSRGGEQIAALASPNCTVEEFYILQKLIRKLGSQNIDHRLRMLDFSDQAAAPEFPNLGLSIAEIETLDTILLVGSEVRFEQPLISNRINQAAQENTRVMVINPVDYPLLFPISEKIITADIVYAVAQVLKSLMEASDQQSHELADVNVDDKSRAIAEKLKAAKKAAIFIGVQALNHPELSKIIALIRKIKSVINVVIGALPEGANACGAWLAGAVPHREPAYRQLEQRGFDAKAVLTCNPVSAYLLMNIEPELDTAYPAAALKTLQEAEFVVCLNPFRSEIMEQYADFILPIAPFSEIEGTFVNVEGVWQSFPVASIPHSEAKPGWKVLQVLAHFMQLDNFDYKSVNDVRDELKALVDRMPNYQASAVTIPTIKQQENRQLMRLAPWHMYRVDHFVRRSKPLQEMIPESAISITLNQNTAKKFNINGNTRVTAAQGDTHVTLPVVIDDRIADEIVVIPAGFEQTAGFGEAMASVTFETLGENA